MKIDKSDYYPYMPGHGPDSDNRDEEEERVSGESRQDIAAEKEKEEDVVEACGNGENHDAGDRNEADDVNTVVTRTSNLLSWVMVPMLVSVWATIMMFNLSALSMVPTATKTVFTLIVFGFNAVVPMVLVFVLKAMGIVQDIGLNGRKERLIPYIIMIVSYIGTAIFFYYKGAPLWAAMFFAGAAVAAVINMTVNFRWKISAHACAAAGVVAMLLIIQRVGMPTVDLGWWTAGTVLLCGLLGSARIWLGRHTLGQVLAGYCVGFLSVYLLGFIG